MSSPLAHRHNVPVCSLLNSLLESRQVSHPGSQQRSHRASPANSRRAIQRGSPLRSLPNSLHASLRLIPLSSRSWCRLRYRRCSLHLTHRSRRVNRLSSLLSSLLHSHHQIRPNQLVSRPCNQRKSLPIARRFSLVSSPLLAPLDIHQCSPRVVRHHTRPICLLRHLHLNHHVHQLYSPHNSHFRSLPHSPLLPRLVRPLLNQRPSLQSAVLLQYPLEEMCPS